MSPMASLVAACVAFVGSHFLLSHPLRASLVARLGARPFLGLYSLVALATFAWIVVAYRGVPPQAPLWTPPDWGWMPASLVMLFAAILLVGSFFGNPAMPEARVSDWAPRGVFAVTRHPMMWSFSLWAIVHGWIWSAPANLVLTAAILILALGGAAGQDRKKAVLMGAKWQGWVSRTAFIPFTGRSALGAMWPRWPVLAGGVLLWLIATWAHGPLGGMAVGLWR
jgi:uncharacterized membrane protein